MGRQFLLGEGGGCGEGWGYSSFMGKVASGTLDHATAAYVGLRSLGSEVGQSPLHSPK